MSCPSNMANMTSLYATWEKALRNGRSREENLNREDLTDYEKAIAFARKFERVAKDLVGEDEGVECPECGKECEGRQGLKTHLQMKHEGSDDSSDPFLSDRAVYDEIAEETPYEWRTVERLVKIGQLPDGLLTLVKTPEERREGEVGKLLGLYYQG